VQNEDVPGYAIAYTAHKSSSPVWRKQT